MIFVESIARVRRDHSVGNKGIKQIARERMPVADSLRRQAHLEPRSLHGQSRALRLDLQAACRRIAPEDLERARVQNGEERRVGIVRQRITQGKRAMGGRFHHQALGERLRTVSLFFRRLGRRAIARQRRRGIDCPRLAIPADRVDLHLVTRERIGIAAVLAVGFDGQFILGANEPALDLERAIAADADEGAGAGDLGGIVTEGTVLEGAGRSPPRRVADHATPERHGIDRKDED